MHGKQRVCAVLVILCLSGPVRAASSDDSEMTVPSDKGRLIGKKWPPHIDFTYKGGDDCQLGRLSLMVPLLQSPQALLFGDIRTIYTDDSTTEGNLGLAYRQVLCRSTDGTQGVIVGAYGFYDRQRSAYHCYYNQTTVGGEILTRHFEVRGNAYIPESRSHVIATGLVNEVALSGTTVVARTSTLEARERALPGFDIEAGSGLDLGKIGRLWAYVGYFRFATSGAPEIEGPRVRLQYEMEDPFGWLGSSFSAGYEVRHDEVRGTDNFAVVRLSIPLGKVSVKGSGLPALTGIDRRMVCPIIRDIDVVTFAEDITKPAGSSSGPDVVSTQERPVQDPETGATVDVYFVDANGSIQGTGSRASPMRIDEAEVASGPSDIIFLLNTDGNIDVSAAAGGGLTLKQNQQVVGVGESTSATILLPGGAALTVGDASGLPTLLRPWGGADVVTLASGNTIKGIRVAGGIDGIHGNSINGATIEDTTLLFTGSEAVYLFDIRGTVRISNLFISTTNSSGIWLENSVGGTSATFTVQDCIVENGGGGAVMLRNSGDGATLTGTIERNTATGNSGVGSGILSLGNATITVALTGNVIDSNLGEGIFALTQNTSTQNLTIRNNTVTDNNGDAISLMTLGGSLCANIDGNTPNQQILLQNVIGSFDVERRDTVAARNNNVTVTMAGVINDVPEGTCPTP